MCEVHHDNLFDAIGLEQFELLFGCGQQGWFCAGMNHLQGVLVERNDSRSKSSLQGFRFHLAEQKLMPEVYSIKKSYGSNQLF